MIEHFFTCRVIHRFATYLFSLYILFGIYTIFEPQCQIALFTLTPIVMVVSFVDALVLIIIAFQHVVLNSISLYNFLGGWILVLVASALSFHKVDTTLLPVGVVPTVALYILCIWEMGVRYFLLFRLSENYSVFRAYLLTSPFLLLVLTIASLFAVNYGVRVYHFADTAYIEYFIIILIARVLLHLTVETQSKGNLLTSDQNNHLY